MEGWLGAGLLLLGGAGWGRQLSRRGLTMPALLLTLAVMTLGLALSAAAFVRGQPLPLVLGAVGALLAATLTMLGGRD